MRERRRNRHSGSYPGRIPLSRSIAPPPQHFIAQLNIEMNCSYPEMHYRMLSGWGYNQFGNYEACLSKGYQYGVQVLQYTPLQMMGICYPSQCPPRQDLIDVTTYYPSKGFLFYLVILLISCGLFLSLCAPLYILLKNGLKINNQIPATTVIIPKAFSWSQFLEISLVSFFITHSFRYSNQLVLRTKQLLITPRLIACLLTIYGLVFYVLSLQAPNSVTYVFIGRALYAGDLYLFLSGFMLARQVLVKTSSAFLDRAPFALWYLAELLMRLLRIYPLYLMTFLFFTQLAPHLGYGPRWPGDVIESSCSLWESTLLVGNFFAATTTCRLQTWFICTDFQLYVAGLLLIRLYAKKGTKSLIILCLLVFAGINLIISLSLRFRLAVIMEESQFNQYIKPWARAPIYLFGMWMGISYNEYKNHIQGNIYSFYKQLQFEYKQVAEYFCYGFGLAIIILTLFVPDIQPHSWPIGLQSVWWSLGPYFLIMGVLLLLLPVMISDMNLHIGLKIGSFLSFSASICALQLVLGFGFAFPYSDYFQFEVGLMIFVYMTVLCALFGYVLSLTIEMPYLQIRAYLKRYWTQKYKEEQLL